MDCSKCGGLCCTGQLNIDDDVLLTIEEYEKLVKINDYMVFDRYEAIYYMKLPCVFFKKKRCSIYQHRPLACRRYPLFIDINIGGAYLALEPSCKLVLTAEDPRYNVNLSGGEVLRLSTISEEGLNDMFNSDIELEARIQICMRLMRPKDRFKAKRYDASKKEVTNMLAVNQFDPELYISTTKKVIDKLMGDGYWDFANSHYRKNLKLEKQKRKKKAVTSPIRNRNKKRRLV